MKAGTARARAWWAAERHADRRPRLHARARMLAALRGWFAAGGFIEVEPAALQMSPGNELHLHGFATVLERDDGASAPLYLHTSPEFACKKLLAAGEERIVAVAPVYRNRERSALHHPAFTLVEWYRAGADLSALMADMEAILAVAAMAARVDRFAFRGVSLDPGRAPERLTVAEAFARHLGIDLLAFVGQDGGTDREGFAAAVAGAGVRVAPDDGWSDIFAKALTARIEPQLGRGRATILHDYPRPEAALARVSPADPRVAQRFELYACGVELANGFQELTDPVEQRRRFETDMARKRALYGTAPPLDEDLLAALGVMPEAAGVALGFDRLVMLATAARHIEDVLWAPVPDPWGETCVSEGPWGGRP